MKMQNDPDDQNDETRAAEVQPTSLAEKGMLETAPADSASMAPSCPETATSPEVAPKMEPDPVGTEAPPSKIKAGGFARLAASRRSLPSEDEGEPDDDLPIEDEDGGASHPDVEAASRRNPRKALVVAAMTAAVPAAMHESLLDTSPLALVVSVTSADWVAAVKDFFDEAPYGRKWMCFARDGSERARHKTTVGNAEVASALAKGQSIVGIAVSPDQVLPSTLLAATDWRLKATLGPALLHRTINDLFGETPSSVSDGELARLGLDDLVAAMRPRTDGGTVVSRIAAAAKVRAGHEDAANVPDLATAVEYGAAREWGLALARDMRDYRKGTIPWNAVDRGAIFFSGPGMGKSVLARSLARACDASLVVGSIGEIFATSSGNLDGVIKSMRELFARAVAAAPSILFLDEIDGLPSRESLDSRNRDWWMPVIEDFMLLLDDATSGRRDGVVVIGATNRIDAVDPAILRPGRLERAIEIKPPERDGILNIVRFHVRGGLPDEELMAAIGLMEGFTPAEIMETVRSARRKARHAGRDLSIDDLTAAALPELKVGPDALYRIAVHEAGHVVVAEVCCPGCVMSVRIGGRGGIDGLTRIDPRSDDLVTRQAIEQLIVGLLAGRAAEVVVLGTASAGAGGSGSSDLAIATQMLAAMNSSYGLGDDELVYLGNAEDVNRDLRRDPMTRRWVDKMLKRLQTRALEVVGGRRTEVIRLAEKLVRRRFLSGNEIRSILSPAQAAAHDTPTHGYSGGLT